MNQSEFKANTCNRRQVRENACDQDTIVLAFHWLRKWRELCQPITKPSKAKPKQTRNYFRHSIENCRIRIYVASYFVLSCSPRPSVIPLADLRFLGKKMACQVHVRNNSADLVEHCYVFQGVCFVKYSFFFATL